MSSTLGSSAVEAGVTDSQMQQFNLSFNSNFNEQFNRDYAKQQELLSNNPKFLRTVQSLEAERRNGVGNNYELKPYQMFQEDKQKVTEIKKAALCHQGPEMNMLNSIFLSAENIENIQTRIRYAVWIASNKQHVIGRQDDTELVIIMRSIYLSYGKNQPTMVKEQIDDLNDLVVQECVSKILSQVTQHISYLQRASSLPMPLSQPIMTSNYGKKQLSVKPFI